MLPHALFCFDPKGSAGWVYVVKHAATLGIDPETYTVPVRIVECSDIDAMMFGEGNALSVLVL